MSKKFAVILLMMAQVMGSVMIAHAQAGDPQTHTIIHDGIERTYLLYVPSSYDPSAGAPLVLVLHGGGGTASGMVRGTRGRFNELAERDGWLVVYPQGVGNKWGDGREVNTQMVNGQPVDDVGFLVYLLDMLSQQYVIDPTRVYVTGISNGGAMSFTLACQVTNRFAAAAPVTMSLSGESTCQPSAPISILMLNGTDDPLVPYSGGPITVLGRERGTVTSTDDTLAFWQEHNNCPDQPDTKRINSRPLDRTIVHVTLYTGCAAGTAVGLYRIEGGGHTFPGGRQYLPAALVGRTTREIDGAEVIWDFFTVHARPDN